MKFYNYLRENVEVIQTSNKPSYFDITYEFHLGNTPKLAGFHFSLSEHDKTDIWNFGYSVRLMTKSGALTTDNRDIIKKHTTPEDRSIIKDMLYELLPKFLKKKQVEVIIRGPLTRQKIESDRYKEVGKIIEQMGYKYTHEYKSGEDFYIIHSKNNDDVLTYIHRINKDEK